MTGGADSFLERWSRRKRAGGEAPSEQPRPAEAEMSCDNSPQTPDLSDDELAKLSDAELAERLGLPDPAAMKEGDDFRVFLAAGVPNRLKTLALRRLWRVNPALGALDDLIDYAEDYSNAATALGAAGTTYEVGRGLRAHADRLRETADRLAPSSDDADDNDDGAPDQPAPPAGPPAAAEENIADAAPADGSSGALQSAPEPAPSELSDGGSRPPARRRAMVFRRADSQ